MIIIMLIGPPGSGKTTFAKLLSQKLNAIHIERDFIMKQCQELGFGRNKTKSIFRDKVNILCQNSNIIIFDSCNSNKETRLSILNCYQLNKLIYINFYIHDLKNKISWLLHRCQNRIDHPIFPKSSDHQISELHKCLLKFTYGHIDECNFILNIYPEYDDYTDIIDTLSIC